MKTRPDREKLDRVYAGHIERNGCVDCMDEVTFPICQALRDADDGKPHDRELLGRITGMGSYFQFYVDWAEYLLAKDSQ